MKRQRIARHRQLGAVAAAATVPERRSLIRDRNTLERLAL